MSRGGAEMPLDEGGHMIVTPSLNFSGECEDAIRLYERAFGTKADFAMRYADAKKEDWDKPMSDVQRRYIYHAAMRIGGQRFFLSDIIDFELRKGIASFLSITFDRKEEVERAFSVLSEGGEALIPLRATSYSSCAGNVVDRFGVRWGLLTEQTER
jgi:PhnB protein